MTVEEFLRQTQADVRAGIGERLDGPEGPYPYAETVFTEVVMQHMADIGMTFDPVPCHYEARIGNARLKLSGFAVSEDASEVDLFVSLYDEVDEVATIPDSETKAAAEQCLRFLTRAAEGRLQSSMDPSHDAFELVVTLRDIYAGLDKIRIYVLTDRIAKSRNFKNRDVQGKTIQLEVMDIERLFRHWSAGKPRDEVAINLTDLAGAPLPCVYVPNDLEGYDYALTVFPGEVLRHVYDRYGGRLLEANVRSFLSTTGKVNRGIRDTLRHEPEKFMAFNNGIVLIVDELGLERAEDGTPGINWLRGMQIVNGGQTTASLYFTKKKDPSVDLRRVRVPAKILVLRTREGVDEDALVADISRYANSQNAVRVSDLSANRPFHVEVEKLALTTYCPDGTSRWFYERAAGSYNVMLAREGTTPARLKKLKDSIPTSRKVTKTDLAKVLNIWAGRPHLVALGAQKNFQAFMDELSEREAAGHSVVPDVAAYRRMVAQVIIFKAAQKMMRPMFKAFQANVIAYSLAVMATRLSDRIDFERIWMVQAPSRQLLDQIAAWGREVNAVLHDTAQGRMISEWAKRPECWSAVSAASYPPVADDIPDVR